MSRGRVFAADRRVKRKFSQVASGNGIRERFKARAAGIFEKGPGRATAAARAITIFAQGSSRRPAQNNYSAGATQRRARRRLKLASVLLQAEGDAHETQPTNQPETPSFGFVSANPKSLSLSSEVKLRQQISKAKGTFGPGITNLCSDISRQAHALD